MSPNSGNSSTSEVVRSLVLTDKASQNGLDVLGPCMDWSVYVPKRLYCGGFRLTSNLEINHLISHGSTLATWRLPAKNAMITKPPVSV